MATRAAGGCDSRISFWTISGCETKSAGSYSIASGPPARDHCPTKVHWTLETALRVPHASRQAVFHAFSFFPPGRDSLIRPSVTARRASPRTQTVSAAVIVEVAERIFGNGRSRVVPPRAGLTPAVERLPTHCAAPGISSIRPICLRAAHSIHGERDAICRGTWVWRDDCAWRASGRGAAGRSWSTPASPSVYSRRRCWPKLAPERAGRCCSIPACRSRSFSILAEGGAGAGARMDADPILSVRVTSTPLGHSSQRPTKRSCFSTPATSTTLLTVRFRRLMRWRRRSCCGGCSSFSLHYK